MKLLKPNMLWKTRKKGFTLIELLAVMAILAVLAAMVAPAVTGTKEASVTAKVLQDATQVRSASVSFFKDQTASEAITAHSVTTTTLISGALAGTNAIQKVSSRWSEKYVTIQSGSTDAAVIAIGAVYSEEFNTATSPKVKEVVLQDTDGTTLISGSSFLTSFTAINLETLKAGKYLARLPDSARAVSNGGMDNFLWLYEKNSSSITSTDDDRTIAVFKLIKVERLETETGSFGYGVEHRVKLTYRRIF